MGSVSSLTQAQFEEQCGSERLCAFVSNVSADEAVGKFSTCLDRQQILSTWVDSIGFGREGAFSSFTIFDHPGNASAEGS